MIRVGVLAVVVVLLVGARPTAFAPWYDNGITPNGWTGWVKLGGTSSLDACPLFGDHTGCEPCFGEDNQWKRGWYGDLDAAVVVGQPQGVDLNFCPWNGMATLYYRVRLPRRFDASLFDAGPLEVRFAEDRGIVNGKHEYVGCVFNPRGRHYVTLSTQARDVALEVHVLVRDAAEAWCR